MINLNQKAEMTITGYLPQVEDYVSMFCYEDFIVETRLLKEIYINKYSKIDYNSVTNPLKVVVC